MKNTLILPYPPSINNYHRAGVRGRRAFMYLTKEAKAYRQQVQELLDDQPDFPRFPKPARLEVKIGVYPPDARARDIDNVQKVMLDALEHAGLYDNDSQIDVLFTSRHEKSDQGGHVVFMIHELKPED